MRGTLRMGVSHSFSSSTLPNTLAEFASHYPGVRVVARVVPHLEMEQALVAGELDLAVAYVSDNAEHIAAETLTEEQLVLLVGSAHPWAGRKSVPMRALAEIPLILLTSEFAARQFVDSRFTEARLPANIVLEMNAVEPILATVRNSKFATSCPMARFRRPRACISSVCKIRFRAGPWRSSGGAMGIARPPPNAWRR